MPAAGPVHARPDLRGRLHRFDGVARTSVLLTAPPGDYELVASFPGDGGLQQASSAPAAFSILADADVGHARG